VILPKRNEKDLEELPQNVREALRFEFVEEISQVLEIALPRHVAVL
jgi:ATP-dependent Lon protease